MGQGLQAHSFTKPLRRLLSYLIPACSSHTRPSKFLSHYRSIPCTVYLRTHSAFTKYSFSSPASHPIFIWSYPLTALSFITSSVSLQTPTSSLIPAFLILSLLYSNQWTKLIHLHQSYPRTISFLPDHTVVPLSYIRIGISHTFLIFLFNALEI